ncbi:YhdP family protein [Noviherbaspirillum massiliense]|uniref:YhdP family protein n=1 Tax=Noviherbaspirillum massiliense TaxID=1465823 RepID=UPI0003061EF3|nr:YhdP family protein [Noviherbaspirillum massiliense]
MSIDQQNNKPAAGRLALYWHAFRDGYRTLNTVTHHAAGFMLKLVAVIYFLFCILFLGLRYLVLPNIAEYKPQVEQMAARALGKRVSIDSIEASWTGLRPHLTLGGVAVYDDAGKRALNLPVVSAILSWWSVPAADLRLHALEIERPEMEVMRDASGNLYVAGIFIDNRKSGNGKGADWVLSQREIVIRDGRIRWNDVQRGAPELLLENVDLLLRNQWQSHEFTLHATPPRALAAPLDVRGLFEHPRFTNRISNAALWTGQLYVDLQDTDLPVWKTYVDYPFELLQGRGSVRAWLDFDHARVANFTADLTLSRVSARLRSDLELLNLERVNGRVSVHEEFNPFVQDGKPTLGANGHSMSLTNFSMQTSDGLTLPETSISERYIPARSGKPARTEFAARMLDLETLANFAERLPLPTEQRKMLADFAPRGKLKDFSAQWQGTYPDISAYSIKGQFAGLSLNAQPARPARPKTADAPAQVAIPAIPGFENLTGQIDANERGGGFSLASEQLKLQMPGYFEDPVMLFDRLNMQANWTFQQNDQLLLDVRRMEFVQDGLSGSLSGRHLMPLNRQQSKSPGVIDMSGKVNGLKLENIGRYLPLQTPEELRHWLTGALVGGTARDVNIRLKGDLAHFPFSALVPAEKARGEFSVVGRIEDGRLNYAPGRFGKDVKAPLWPLLEGIRGTIAFNRTRMEIHAESAKTHGVDLANVRAVIPDLPAPDRVLDIDGRANGPLQDFVRYVNDSPVTEWIGHFTEETRANGDAALALKLQLPLAHLENAKVEGSLQFANNTVTLFNALPPLSGASGRLDFSEKGFNLNGIRAGFLGGPVMVSGGSLRDGSILVKGEGSLTAEGIRKNYPAPGAQRMTARISGSTRYSTTIRVRNKHPEVVVESGLQGIALDFPAPVGKSAQETMPLKFELTGLPSADPALSRDELKLSLGAAIAARYEREKSAGKDAQWRVLRGGIGVNAPPPQPDSGLVANVNLGVLNVDAWKKVAGSLASGDQDKADANVPEAQGTPDIAQYVEPEVLAARAVELIIMGKKLDNVVVGASHQEGMWQANIDADQASGYVTWNESRSGRGLGKVTARLASLIIPKSAASDVTDLLEGKGTTTQIPALDIVAENFELSGTKFGHLELVAHNARTPAGNEWRINRLSIANPDADLKASGKWTSSDGQNVTALNYTFNIADAGRLLNRFGFANVLRGGKGKMEGEVSWKDMPFSFDIPSLSGQIRLDMASGQFLKVDPAAAKLLGVLSLQSLPRRLILDFRDVFSEGFAFDGVTANATINQGVARTDNFKMRSVAATVLIDGSADITKESQNLHVVVIPEINVGAASVVYGLAINPAIGVGSFLAQLFLREPLMKAFTFEYQVTGPWKEPVVTKLVRKPNVTPNSSEANEQPDRSG